MSISTVFDFQDQNLIPMKDEAQMVTIEIKHKSSFLFKMEKCSKFDRLRKIISEENRIHLSAARLVFEGERIHPDETPYSLGLKNGDVIEVFTKMTGGGRPEKKNIFDNHAKILDALDLDLSVSEDSEDSEEWTSSDENEEEIKNLSSETKECNTIRDNESQENTESMLLQNSLERVSSNEKFVKFNS